MAMQKMVTFIPPDPKLVLALEITEETWPYFLRLLETDDPPFEKNVALGGYIVVSIDSPCEWGWMRNKDFNELYEKEDSPSIFPTYHARK